MTIPNTSTLDPSTHGWNPIIALKSLLYNSLWRSLMKKGMKFHSILYTMGMPCLRTRYSFKRHKVVNKNILHQMKKNTEVIWGPTKRKETHIRHLSGLYVVYALQGTALQRTSFAVTLHCPRLVLSIWRLGVGFDVPPNFLQPTFDGVRDPRCEGLLKFSSVLSSFNSPRKAPPPWRRAKGTPWRSEAVCIARL